MCELAYFHEKDPEEAVFHSRNPEEIARFLGERGIRFERWAANGPVKAGDSQETVLAAYADDIDRLVSAEGYQTVDVVSLAPDNPDKDAFRQKFLDEHTHSEDEVRFFVDGSGLFTLHIDDGVYEVLCEKGELIGVPANTRHWFDMGPNPSFVAIRFFNNPEGWVARYTNSDIASRFHRLDN